MRFIFGKRMFFLPILTKSLENAHDLPMILELQGSQIIPQQETSGNYNCFVSRCVRFYKTSAPPETCPGVERHVGALRGLANK